jgi:hypothetical protein
MSKAKLIMQAFKLAKKSYGKIKKAKSFSKGGVESAFKKAKVTPTSLCKITKSKATKGVESAGVVKNVAKAKAKENAILAGTAAVVGASVAYNKNKANKAKKAAAQKPATKKSKAPVASAKKATVKIAPYEPKALVTKSKPRASSFKPTAKKTPAVTGKTKTKKAKTVRRRAGVASSSRSRR